MKPFAKFLKHHLFSNDFISTFPTTATAPTIPLGESPDPGSALTASSSFYPNTVEGVSIIAVPAAAMVMERMRESWKPTEVIKIEDLDDQYTLFEYIPPHSLVASSVTGFTRADIDFKKRMNLRIELLMLQDMLRHDLTQTHKSFSNVPFRSGLGVLSDYAGPVAYQLTSKLLLSVSPPNAIMAALEVSRMINLFSFIYLYLFLYLFLFC